MLECAGGPAAPRDVRGDASRTNLRVGAGLSPALLSLAALPWKSGLAELELDVPDQGARAVTVWIPERAAPRAVLVLLHGAVVARYSETRSRNQSVRLVECLLAPALGELQPLILAPQSPDGQWWNPDDTELVLGLVAAARVRWPDAAKRVVVLGYSNGGIGAWYFARAYPQYFSAAIPIAFNPTVVGPSPLPIFAIQGSRDELFDFDSVRAAVDALKQRGHDVTFTEKYRGSHFAPCSYVPELALARRWLVDHAWLERH